jgi:hypothetical protein
MEIVPPECCTEPRTPCSEKGWVQCAECARLICTVHDEVIPVRYAGKYAANTDNVCTACAEILYERGDLQMNRSGYQYINHR